MPEEQLRSLSTTRQTTMLAAGSRTDNWSAAAVLLFSIALAFSPVLVANYLGLDDTTHITNNPGLQRLSGRGLMNFWMASYFSLYIPVTYSFWWLLAAFARLFGPLVQTAWLFHAANWVLHGVNAWLVFLIIRTLLLLRQEKPFPTFTEHVSSISLIAALFFGLHPVQVETVAWISECKGELSTALVLLGVWNYYNRPAKYLTCLAFVLAMLSKPAAIIAPGILFLFDRVLLRRSLKSSIVTPSLTLLLLLPFVAITKRLQPDIDFSPTFIQRGYIASDALVFYLSKLFAPVSLALDYGRSPESVLLTISGLRLVIGIAVLLGTLAIATYAIWSNRPRSVWLSFVVCGWSVFALSLVLPGELIAEEGGRCEAAS
jgi:protein O-mannosyl-transferase